MAYIRKLPSGKWQATVRHPSGQRITKTDALKRAVAEWAREEEAKYARGDVRDPRAGRIKVGEWYERWIAARGVEPVTVTKLESIWRTHCEPQWSRWPMDSITVMEAQEWANALRKTRRARHNGRQVVEGDEPAPLLAATTVREAVNLMSSLYVGAMKGRPPIVLSNPFHDLDLPRVPPAPIEFLDHDEADAIMAAIRALRPKEPEWALLIEMGTWMGLRLGELFGLPGSRIGWLRHEVQVTQVMTRAGLRDYPKTRKSFRVVPMPRPDMTGDLGALFAGRGREQLAFARPRGGPVEDAWFRHRVWVPALTRAGVRPLPPRVMRHTAASWLVQDGVDLYRVQALLGHESITTTQRYAHLAPDSHEVVRDSWRRISDARTPKPRHGAGPA
jgi:site-specific recombinase XerD